MATPTIKVSSLLKGDDKFEAKRAELLATYPSGIPKDLILAQKYIEHPALDVTGVPRECGLLSPEEIEITEKYDAVGLAEAIASQKLTAVAVVTAYCKRAAIAHQLTNCLTEWFMDEAVSRAKELDDYQKRTGKTIGPLHGVPISVKEMVPLKGHMTSLSLLVTMHIDEQDCFLTEIVRKLGGVFYVKTRQPQAVMTPECTSTLGRTLNPNNINLSSGGSSGGEGALLALKGSILGIGSDIGGSIRIPSAFNGTYGLKGTSGSLPIAGMLNVAFPAGINLQGIIGPLGRSLRDIDFFQRVVLAEKPYLQDPYVTPFPWTGLSTPAPASPLKIGIMFHDGYVYPQPPVVRALQWAQSRLTDAGYKLTPFLPPDQAKAQALLFKLFFPDGGKSVRGALAAAGEPLTALLVEMMRPVESMGEMTAMELAECRLQRDQYRLQMAQSWLDQGDPDIVICPSFYGTACAHDTAAGVSYTAIWNLVDYPGISIPTPIKAQKGGEKYASDAPGPLSDLDTHIRKLWGDGSQFEGAPAGLQVVARRFHDNELIGALGALKQVLELP